MSEISSLYLWLGIKASFCGCAGRFVSYLVTNAKDRFSHDEADILISFTRFDVNMPEKMSLRNKKYENWGLLTVGKTQIQQKLNIEKKKNSNCQHMIDLLQ